MAWWRLARLMALASGVVAVVACQARGLETPFGKAEMASFGHLTSYEPAPCWFEVRADHPISCGRLMVPEDWTAAEGRQLHLPIVTFHTASGRRRAEPIVYLTGGPGGHSDIRSAREIEDWLGFLDDEPWTRAHDVIVIAQRGTAWTDSDLSCPELLDPMIRVTVGDAPGVWVDRQERMRDAVVACRERLTSQGHVLGAYNTTQSARDVAALRPLLGLETWSLYGESYGTRFALAVMRDHPEGIRSVILDSPYPPQLTTLGFDGAGLMDALDQVLDGCAADARCRSRHPNLWRDLTTVLKQLRATPLQLPVTSADGARTLYLRIDDIEVLDALLGYLRDPDLVEDVPDLIEEIKERPGRFAARYREYLFEDPEEDSSEGAYLSIVCNDEYAAQGPGYWIDEAKRQPLLAPWLLAQPAITPCDLWPVSPIDSADRQPVRSGIPTLILAGALDPTTPPDFARATAATLDRAHLFVFPGVTHGVLGVDACASDVVEAFLEQPELRPEVKCRGATPAPTIDDYAMSG